MRLARLALCATLLLAACGGGSGPTPARHDGLEVEPNDAPSTATDGFGAAKDGWIAGRIGRGGDVDVYRVVVPSGARAVLVATTTDAGRAGCAGVDTVVEVLDGAGHVLTRSDDDGAGLCGRAVVQLAPGTVFVRVSAWSPPAVFDYALHLELAAPGVELEPNDAAAGAAPFEALAAANLLYGALDSAADVDLYRVDLPRGGLLTAGIAGKDGACPPPGGPALAVVSAAGDDAGLPAGCLAHVVRLAAGTWYLRVSAPAASVKLEYRLYATTMPFGEIEPNDAPAQATDWDAASVQVTGNTRLVRGLISPTDVDHFSVALRPGGPSQVVVSLLDASGAGCGPQDAQVDLLDDAGAVLATSERPGAAGCASALALVAQASVIVRVRPGVGPGGDYGLAADFGPVAVTEQEPNDTLGTARPVSVATGSGLISPLSDVDYWRVEVPAGGAGLTTYAFDLGTPTCTGGVRVTILDGAGHAIADSADNTCGNAGAWLAVRGTYFVRVEASGAATRPFGYDLSAYVQPAVPEREPNGTVATGLDLVFGQLPNGGTISPAGDVDVWRFTTAAPMASVRAFTDDFGRCRQSATSLELLDAGDNVLASAVGDLAAGSCPVVTAALPAGTHGVRVAQAAGTLVFGYTLRADLTEFTPAEVEPNESLGTAGDWAAAAAGHLGLATGAVSPAGDVDLWRIEATRRGYVYTQVDDPTGFYCATASAGLRLLDGAGAEVVHQLPGYCGFTWALIDPGTYYVEVSGGGAAITFGYGLRVTLP